MGGDDNLSSNGQLSNSKFQMPILPTFRPDPQIQFMKISFWSIGKAHEGYVKSGVDEFTKRLTNYFPVQWTIIPVPKNAGMLSEADLKKREGEMILGFLKDDDYLI